MRTQWPFALKNSWRHKQARTQTESRGKCLFLTVCFTSVHTMLHLCLCLRLRWLHRVNQCDRVKQRERESLRFVFARHILIIYNWKRKYIRDSGKLAAQTICRWRDVNEKLYSNVGTSYSNALSSVYFLFQPVRRQRINQPGSKKTPKAIPIKTRSCGDCFVFVMNKIFPFLPNPELMFIFDPGSNKSTRDLISWQRSIHWFSAHVELTEIGSTMEPIPEWAPLVSEHLTKFLRQSNCQGWWSLTGGSTVKKKKRKKKKKRT